MLIKKHFNLHSSLRFRNVCTTAIFWIIGLLLFSGYATTAKTTQKCPFDKPAVSQTLQQAESGDSTAQYQVGLWNLRGLCPNRDNSEANKWFLKAAKQGHVDAQVRIANNYWLVDSDTDNAIHWYQRAAE